MKRLSSRRLGVETLESRDLMAGDVTVTVSRAGDLVIAGDEQSNIFSVVQTGAGTFQVTGVGTTINGSATAATVSGVKRNLFIDTFAGNDRVTIGSATSTTRLPLDSRVRTGSGADLLLVQRVVGRNATAVMGTNLENDVDKITVKSTTFTGRSLLQTGNGDDVIVLTNAKSLVSLTIDLAGGNDSATVTNGTVGDITLNCGAGNDTGTFAGTLRSTGEIVADGSAGNDTAFKKPGTKLFVSDTTPTFSGFEVDNIS